MNEIWLIYTLIMATVIVILLMCYSSTSYAIYYDMRDVESMRRVAPSILRIQFKSGNFEHVRSSEHQTNCVIDAYYKYRNENQFNKVS